MSAARSHRQLTGEERFRLGQLVRAAAQYMPGPEGREMEVLFGRLMADDQHLRGRARRLGQALSQARVAAEPPAPEEQPIPCVRVVA